MTTVENEELKWKSAGELNFNGSEALLDFLTKYFRKEPRKGTKILE